MPRSTSTNSLDCIADVPIDQQYSHYDERCRRTESIVTHLCNQSDIIDCGFVWLLRDTSMRNVLQYKVLRILYARWHHTCILPRRAPEICAGVRQPIDSSPSTRKRRTL